MIVPMKKVTVLVLENDRDAALEYLREIGVLHVEAVRAVESDDVESARKELEYVSRALDVLPAAPEAAESGKSPLDIVHETWRILRERTDVLDELEDLRHEARRIEPFGDFDPVAVRDLAARGVVIRLFSCSPTAPAGAPDGVLRIELGRTKNAVYFAIVHRGAAPEIDAQEERMPERSLADIRRRMSGLDAKRDALQRDLAGFAGDRPRVEAIVDEAADRLSLAEARAGMGAAGDRILYLQGFCPAVDIGCIREAARACGWGVIDGEPGEEDRVPTLVRSPKWVRPIQTVFKLVGILPGYREIDISAVFLLFFSLFFAMLVGDAGYGFLFLGLTLWARKKLHGKPSPAVALMLIMSVCTIAWGVLSATWFGIDPDKLPAVLRSLRLDWLSGARSQDNIMGLCFLIGAVQLSIAHLWNIGRMRRSLEALAQIGWLGITWVMYAAAGGMVLNRPFPPAMFGVLGVSAALIILFMTPVRKLKSEWFNHVMLPLNFVSSFVDIVSYIRLFAVGTATVAVAQAFNDIALGDGISSIGGGIAAALILFVGHALNIVLAGMGVIVHGVRLNTLEFSGHLGMQWTGVPYRPFARAAGADGEAAGRSAE